MGQGLNKRRGWFLYFFKGSRRFLLVFLAVDAIVSWLIKLAAYFCQCLLITSRIYCPMIKVDLLTVGVFL